MTWKNIKRRAKITWILFYFVAVILFVGWTAVMTWLTMNNSKAVDNSHVVNYLSLAIGLASLPGALFQLLSLVEINKKKEYLATMPCPKCRNKVDITLQEK